MAIRNVAMGVVVLLVLVLGACRPAPEESPPVAEPEPTEPGPTEGETTETETEEVEEGVVTAAASDVRRVYLEYLPEGGEECLRVHDPSTSIQRRRPPSRVQWQEFDTEEELQWVIEFDEAKGGDPVLPGRMVIPCRLGSGYRSPLPTGTGDARWTYSVSVFECENGQPRNEPVCMVDPEILIWK